MLTHTRMCHWCSWVQLQFIDFGCAMLPFGGEGFTPFRVATFEEGCMSIIFLHESSEGMNTKMAA